MFEFSFFRWKSLLIRETICHANTILYLCCVCVCVCWRGILLFLINFILCVTSAIHIWDNETLSVEVNKVSIEYTFHCRQRTNIYRYGNHAREDMIYRLVDAAVRARCSRDIQQWFKYSEARGQNVALLYITVIFFFLSFHTRIRFSGSLSLNPSPRYVVSRSF